MGYSPFYDSNKLAIYGYLVIALGYLLLAVSVSERPYVNV